MIEGDVKVIFGSATPSFESYYQSEKNDIELVELKERFNSAKMPDYEIVDLNNTPDNFSEELLKEMSGALGQGGESHDRMLTVDRQEIVMRTRGETAAQPAGTESPPWQVTIMSIFASSATSL